MGSTLNCVAVQNWRPCQVKQTLTRAVGWAKSSTRTLQVATPSADAAALHDAVFVPKAASTDIGRPSSAPSHDTTPVTDCVPPRRMDGLATDAATLQPVRGVGGGGATVGGGGATGAGGGGGTGVAVGGRGVAVGGRGVEVAVGGTGVGGSGAGGGGSGVAVGTSVAVGTGVTVGCTIAVTAATGGRAITVTTSAATADGG